LASPRYSGTEVESRIEASQYAASTQPVRHIGLVEDQRVDHTALGASANGVASYESRLPDRCLVVWKTIAFSRTVSGRGSA
jgi:hypothetical protein